jgi:hypothetical protein
MVVSNKSIPLATLALSIALSGAVPASAQAFSDQTVAAGMVHMTSLSIDTSQRQMFSGGAVGDFNRDGWPDVFLLGGGSDGNPDSLFINNGDGTFTNRAAEWGVDYAHRGRGAAAGDFNNDGWPDIYVTSGGDLTDGDRVGVHRLYRNNGDGTFTDVAVSAGVNRNSFQYLTATGAAFGDYDLDGDLDLYVCGWEGVDSNRLFMNNGDETFTDATITAQIGFHFFGFSPRFVDMNGDRYPELLVASDFFTSKYFLNNGDGTFTDATVASGTGLEHNGMGSTVADFNRDGLPDWYVTSIYDDETDKDGNYLYINQGNDQYTVLPEPEGARNGGWGWGVDALDFDHDGFVDLIETNGWMPEQWATENSYLFRNNGNMTFSEAQGGISGFSHVTQGRQRRLRTGHELARGRARHQRGSDARARRLRRARRRHDRRRDAVFLAQRRSDLPGHEPAGRPLRSGRGHGGGSARRRVGQRNVHGPERRRGEPDHHGDAGDRRRPRRGVVRARAGGADARRPQSGHGRDRRQLHAVLRIHEPHDLLRAARGRGQPRLHRRRLLAWKLGHDVVRCRRALRRVLRHRGQHRRRRGLLRSRLDGPGAARGHRDRRLRPAPGSVGNL